MSERKSCPSCSETVRGDSSHCCYCGHEFGGTRTHHGQVPVSSESKGELSLTRLGVALVVLGSAIAAAALVLL